MELELVHREGTVMSFCQYGTGITVLGKSKNSLLILNFCSCFPHANPDFVL